MVEIQSLFSGLIIDECKNDKPRQLDPKKERETYLAISQQNETRPKSEYQIVTDEIAIEYGKGF
ncbi:MAG: hypothetical protein ACJA08_002098 [Cyclobacteriaceae bacterium]|jgi:hypothetical protein